MLIALLLCIFAIYKGGKMFLVSRRYKINEKLEELNALEVESEAIDLDSKIIGMKKDVENKLKQNEDLKDDDK